MVELFIFSNWGSGDVQSWDSGKDDEFDPFDPEVRFILPGDESDDDYLDNSSSTSEISTTDSELLFH